MARSVVFMGTPDAAVVVLDAVVAEGHRVELVVTRPDKRRGRGGVLAPSPVKKRALELGLEVTDDLEEVGRRSFAHDTIGVVVAYGRIIPEHLLARMPMVNVHFSLLPRWRGAAPVERAILAGDAITGICIMEMEAGLDTGAVLARREVAVGQMDSRALTQRLATEGAALLREVLRGPMDSAEPQRGEVTYAAKIEPHELRIDWNRPCHEVLRQIRALPAYTVLRGSRVRVVRAEMAEGSAEPALLADDATVGTATDKVTLLVVRPESRRDMDATAWVRGLKSALPDRFE